MAISDLNCRRQNNIYVRFARYNVCGYPLQIVRTVYVTSDLEMLELGIVEVQVFCTVTDLLTDGQFEARVLESFLRYRPFFARLYCIPINEMPSSHSCIKDPIQLVLAILSATLKSANEFLVE